METKERPKVGMGVYIADGKGKILMMLRKGAHAAGTWCPPGGHLELGESFLQCAARETLEETGLKVGSIEILGVVNDIFTPGKHYVNVDVFAKGVEGQPKNLEPEKCEELRWADLKNLPSPLMLSTENLFNTYPDLLNRLYKLNSFE